MRGPVVARGTSSGRTSPGSSPPDCTSPGEPDDAYNAWVYCSDADLTDAVLSTVDLTSADLTGVTLLSADLEDVHLTGAKLSGTSLPGVNLRAPNPEASIVVERISPEPTSEVSTCVVITSPPPTWCRSRPYTHP